MHPINSAQFNRVINEGQVYSKPLNDSTKELRNRCYRCKPCRCQQWSTCALADALEDRKELSLCGALRFTAVRIDVLMHTAAALIVLCCITRCQASQATAITSAVRQPKQTEKHSVHMVCLCYAHTQTQTCTDTGL